MVRRPSVVHTFKVKYLRGQLANFDYICIIIRVGERLHNVLGHIWSKLRFPRQPKAPTDLHWQVTRAGIICRTSSNSGQIRPVTLELLVTEHLKKCCEHNSTFIFGRIFIKLAGNKNMHKVLDEFDFQSDRTIFFGVTHTWASKIFPIDL